METLRVSICSTWRQPALQHNSNGFAWISCSHQSRNPLRLNERVLQDEHFSENTYIVLVSDDSKPLKSLQTDAVGGSALVVEDGAHETHTFCVIIMEVDTTAFVRGRLSFRKVRTKKSFEDWRCQAQDLRRDLELSLAADEDDIPLGIDGVDVGHIVGFNRQRS